MAGGTCTDGEANQNELLVDCGGVCDPCVIPAVMVDFVRGGSSANTPQADQFEVKNGTNGNFDFFRVAYLKFDLSGVAADATISQATLSLDIVSGTAGLLSWRIAEVVDGNGWVDNNWDQGITFNTRPTAGADHTPMGQTDYFVDIMAGPLALRPDRLTPGGLMGLYFELVSQSSTVFTGSATASAYVLELD